MQAFEFHAGEMSIRELFNVPLGYNPTSPYLAPNALNFLSNNANLLVTGTLDSQDRPWSSILWGEPGFIMGLNNTMVGLSASAGHGDPIFDTMGDGKEFKGRKVSGLAVNLAGKRRWKIFGRLNMGKFETAAGGDYGKVQMLLNILESLGNCPKYITTRYLTPIASTQTQPPKSREPPIISTALSPAAISIIQNTDLFFITSHSTITDTMDTNLRGGAPGFVRILPPNPSSSSSADTTTKDPTSLIWPDYSGNRLFQTLGNLQTNPRAGLTFPDFTTGNILYLTGHTELLFRENADKLLPRSSLAIKFTVEEARWVENSLGIRELAEDHVKASLSPYNPPIRYLPTERQSTLAQAADVQATVKLEKILEVTPTIKLFTFEITQPSSAKKDNDVEWKEGQYVTLDFSKELGRGYRHMDESDPRHLNDDYYRSWTVISPPSITSSTTTTTTTTTATDSGISAIKTEKEKKKELSLLVRLIPGGAVTPYLFKQRQPTADSYRIEVPVRGFGGDFFFSAAPKRDVNIVVAGVGITPVLAQICGLEGAASLEREGEGEAGGIRINLYWSVNFRDVGLVEWVLGNYPQFGRVPETLAPPQVSGEEDLEKKKKKKSFEVDLKVFITGGPQDAEIGRVTELVEKVGGSVRQGRITRDDLVVPLDLEGMHSRLGMDEKNENEKDKERWYVCTGDVLRNQILSWFKDGESAGGGVEREVVSEEFSY
ncbi:hypothetical protein DFH27DRAFT_316401 [Peziza echinospora]|nr:hypothetical protein DFH27DRAFT_316401 [Peziza echinospora]